MHHRGKVGMAGFEPATFGSQSRRATKLRHIPFMLQVRVELTIKIEQILSLPRLPIPPQEQVET